MKNRLPSAGVFVAGYVLLAVLSGALVIWQRGPVAVMVWFAIPILFAAFYYPRRACLLMDVFLVALAIVVIPYAARDVEGAIRVSAAAGFTIAIVVEVIQRITAAQKRVTAALQEREEIERYYSQKLAMLHEVSLALSLAPSWDDLCRLAIELGHSRLGFDRLGMWFVDPADNDYMLGTFGIDERGQIRDERQRRLLIGPGTTTRRALLAGHVPIQYAEEDDLLDDQSQPIGRGPKAAAALWDGEKIIGFISTDTFFTRRPLTERERDLLMLYARTVGHLSTLKRREEALRQSNSELQARNEDLDAFAHTVAHDLKSPLTLMFGYADALMMSKAQLSAAEEQLYLKRIIENSQRMNNIIEEMLLLAGMRKEDVALQPQEMERVVTEALQRLDHLVKSTQAEVKVAPAWPTALGHAPWIEEVWVNYISNAIKYGGSPPCIELGAETDMDGAVRFWVRDNGVGLSAEEQGRLFVPFARLDQARATGHGLGLSIVRRIVEKMGGEVGIESEVGGGSTFFFTLPGVGSAGER